MALPGPPLPRGVRDMRVSVPDDSWIEPLRDMDVELLVWDLSSEQPSGYFDLVVWPYTVDFTAMASLDTSRVGVIQTQALGYDGVVDQLPAGGVLCNAVGVHEDSTAELALALTLASQRRFDLFLRQQADADWVPSWTPSLIDRRVLVIGAGGIANAIVRRLDGFGCAVDRVARSQRSDELGRVHGLVQLPDLLAHADVVILAVTLNDSTIAMVNDEFLAALPDQALVVNVSRGKIVDTDALLRAVGRIRFASDVTDPEPLPPSHRLWTSPGVILTPHIGGMSSAMRPRIERVVRDQINQLLDGGEPLHVVVRT